MSETWRLVRVVTYHVFILINRTLCKHPRKIDFLVAFKVFVAEIWEIGFRSKRPATSPCEYLCNILPPSIAYIWIGWSGLTPSISRKTSCLLKFIDFGICVSRFISGRWRLITCVMCLENTVINIDFYF